MATAQMQPKAAVAFTLPCYDGREAEYVSRVLAGGQTSGDGPFTKECERRLEAALGVNRALLTSSCTHALEMAALLLDIGPGDEVVLPSYAFASCANAFVLRGARPVFADIRPDTFNLDEGVLESLLSPRTRAVLVVHYAGVACEMDDILGLLAGRGIAVVEDNAHGPFARYRGRPLGTLGELGALSFHETKNLSCGEGGALLMSAEHVARAEVLREKGTDRSRFYRGQVDKYTWVDVGSSFVMSDLLAAILLAQMEARERVQEGRRLVWERYDAELRGWAADNGVQLPFVPVHCEQAHHMYYMVMPTLQARSALIQHLADCQISAAFHYSPLHLSSFGRSFGGRPGDCPVAESASERLLRLPLHPKISESDQERVIDAVREFSVTATLAAAHRTGH